VARMSKAKSGILQHDKPFPHVAALMRATCWQAHTWARRHPPARGRCDPVGALPTLRVIQFSQIYRPDVGSCGASTLGGAANAGNGSLRTGAVGEGKLSTWRAAGSVASAMAAWPSAVG
jgi:hypothetical protein